MQPSQRETGARALALSLVYVRDERRTIEELVRIRRLVGPDVTTLIGGRAVVQIRSNLDESGIVCVDDIAEFTSALEAIAS